MASSTDKTDPFAFQDTRVPDRRKLREQAREALERGFNGLPMMALADATENEASGYSVTRLVEDLRIYQAELEVQNEQLRDTQAEAQNSARRFGSLFNGVPVAVMVVENFGLITHSNPAAIRLFGLDERHLRQNFMLRLIDRVDGERVTGALNRLFGGEPTMCGAVTFRGGANKTFVGDMHLAQIEGSASGVSQFICAVVDQTALIDERRKLEAHGDALRRSEQRLLAVLNSALDAIIGIDARGNIIVFNPAAEALFGLTSTQATNLPLAQLLPDANIALDEASAQAGHCIREWRAITSTGRGLTVEVAVTRDTTGDGPMTIFFVRDVSARKQAEIHKQLLEAQLMESQKMQAIGTLAGGIAHDFNNMLGAILGNVALARLDAAPSTPLMDSLEEIRKAGTRARELVRQILAFSRPDAATRQRIRLDAVIHETLALVRVGMPAGAELKHSVAADLPMVAADPTQVEQAILNLCTNALQFLEGGHGVVELEARALEPDMMTCERLGLSPSLHVVISVSDNGMGMSDDVQQHAFEPFFTTRPVGQGTGLGLSVVHGVMRSHHGAVGLRSVPGKGSTFTLYFPAALQSVVNVADAEAVMADAPSANGHGERVMYVDDDEALVYLVERLLSRKGYRVSGFTDPGAALATLAANPAGADLLITDYNMPGMSGFDVAREAHRIRPDLPLIMSSGYVTAEVEASARAAGIHAVLHKPNQLEEMCDIVQKIMQELPVRG
jgi:PAS domain S-box-containing protein